MILHVDMDAFYASVEIRDNPALDGKPVLVGGSPKGRGVVCAASYPARKFGVRAAMPMSRAVALCPQGIVVPPRMSHYAMVSEQIREIFFRYTPLVEPLSLDEAFLDVAGSVPLFGSPVVIAEKIRSDIKTELQLPASVGVAPCKFVAKIASDIRKPNGLVVVTAAEMQAFLDPLPIGRLWGVGPKTEQHLLAAGLRTLADVRRQSSLSVERLVGQWGNKLWELSQGIDNRQVVPDRDAKSISQETTFDTDIHDREMLRAWLVDLAEQVAWRLRRHHLRGKTVQLKYRTSDFKTVTRGVTLSKPVSTSQAIVAASLELFETLLKSVSQRGYRQSVRLLGVGISGLESADAPTQKLLFDSSDVEQPQQLDALRDSIRDRFGNNALRRGSHLLLNTEPRPENVHPKNNHSKAE